METMRGGKPDKRGYMSINIRIAPAHYERLVRMAKYHGRSLSSECVQLMREASLMWKEEEEYGNVPIMK